MVALTLRTHKDKTALTAEDASTSIIPDACYSLLPLIYSSLDSNLLGQGLKTKCRSEISGSLHLCRLLLLKPLPPLHVEPFSPLYNLHSLLFLPIQHNSAINYKNSGNEWQAACKLLLSSYIGWVPALSFDSNITGFVIDGMLPPPEL